MRARLRSLYLDALQHGKKHGILIIVLAISGLGLPPAVHGQCQADKNWIPKTSEPASEKPKPHPAPDCPFYQAAWQHFLFSTQPDGNGLPAFFSYPTIEDLFGAASGQTFARRLTKPGAKSADRTVLSLAVRTPEHPHVSVSGQQPERVVGSDIFQAGFSSVLVDRNGHPVYYSVQVNEHYRRFLQLAGLHTRDDLRNASETLSFTTTVKGEVIKGIAEFKSAWQIVDDKTPPSNYVLAKARVPTVELSNGKLIVNSANPRQVTVALLALHVVFILDGHPEFIWSTFEHADQNGVPDLAPSAAQNQTGDLGNASVSDKDFLLYKAGTPAAQANTPLDQKFFDVNTQSFRSASGAPFQTSIYRLFPASKSDTTALDDEVEEINKSMGELFSQLPAGSKDVRANYRLIGAVWLDDPDKAFRLDKFFETQTGHSPDEIGAVPAGEDRLSNMAVESFTQDQTAAFPQCFSCHNTKGIDEVIGTPLGPKLLNVSHVLSKFLASEEMSKVTFDQLSAFHKSKDSKASKARKNSSNKKK
jgi:hypothetical protein